MIPKNLTNLLPFDLSLNSTFIDIKTEKKLDKSAIVTL